MNLRHLLRMSRWAHRPPTAKRVKMVFLVILFCLLLVALERLLGWPDWLTVDGNANRRFRPILLKNNVLRVQKIGP